MADDDTTVDTATQPTLDTSNPLYYSAGLAGLLNTYAGGMTNPQQRQEAQNNVMQLMQHATKQAMQANSPMRKVGNVLTDIGSAISGIAPNAAGVSSNMPSVINNIAGRARMSQQADERNIVDQLKLAQMNSQIGLDPKMLTQLINGYSKGGAIANTMEKNRISAQRANAYTQSLGDLTQIRQENNAIGWMNAFTNQDKASELAVSHRNTEKLTARGQDLRAYTGMLLAQAQSDPNNPKYQTALAEAQGKLDENYDKLLAERQKQKAELQRLGAETTKDPTTGLETWKYQARDPKTGVPTGQPVTFSLSPLPPKPTIPTKTSANPLDTGTLESRISEPLDLEEPGNTTQTSSPTLPSTAAPLRGPIQEQPQGVPQKRNLLQVVSPATETGGPLQPGDSAARVPQTLSKSGTAPEPHALGQTPSANGAQQVANTQLREVPAADMAKIQSNFNKDYQSAKTPKAKAQVIVDFHNAALKHGFKSWDPIKNVGQVASTGR